MIRKVLIWHLMAIVPLTITCWHYFASQQFLSFLLGATVVFVNTALMMWGWSLIMLHKKGNKALIILGIKYLILIGFISLSGFISWIDTGFFLAGLSTFFVPLMSLSVLWWQSFKDKKSF